MCNKKVNDTPFFSLIIPVYNLKGYLENCLQSIKIQTFGNTEIILIDDGSTDGSERICDQYAEEDDRVIVIHTANGGVSVARNLGLQKASGKYIVFIDGDDIIKYNYLQTFYKLICIEDDVDIAFCGVEIYGRNSVLQGSHAKDGLLTKEEMLEHLYRRDSFRGYLFNKAYKKSIIQNNHITFQKDIHICEDLLFNTEFIINADIGRLENCANYIYVQRQNSAVHARFNLKQYTVINAYFQIEKKLQGYSSDYIFNLVYGNLLAHSATLFLKTILTRDGEVLKIHHNLKKMIIKNFGYFFKNKYEKKVFFKILLARVLSVF